MATSHIHVVPVFVSRLLNVFNVKVTGNEHEYEYHHAQCECHSLKYCPRYYYH